MTKFEKVLKERGLTPDNSVVVTHGPCDLEVFLAKECVYKKLTVP
jgi:hypothetical protein